MSAGRGAMESPKKVVDGGEKKAGGSNSFATPVKSSKSYRSTKS